MYAMCKYTNKYRLTELMEFIHCLNGIHPLSQLVIKYNNFFKKSYLILLIDQICNLKFGSPDLINRVHTN